jgi:Sulfotransferase domain
VISAEDIRANPRQSLTNLCAALNLPFTDAMLHWPPGPKSYDGVWAPHWYNAVHRSTGFEDPEGPLPDLSPADQRLADQALPAYHRLAAHKL